VKFTPLPMTYSELLPDLVKNALVAICLAKTLQPPYSRFYDANAKCEYHSGEVSHSIENCRPLKFKVQSLIDSGWLTFQEQKPNVDKNPLSGHANATVNVVMEEEKPSWVRSVNEMKKPMKEVFRAICHAGYSHMNIGRKINVVSMLAPNILLMSVLNLKILCKT